MAEASLQCPKCKEEDLNFEIIIEEADDGTWYSGRFIKDEQVCDCEFSEAQITILEGDASFNYAEGIHSYEP